MKEINIEGLKYQTVETTEKNDCKGCIFETDRPRCRITVNEKGCSGVKWALKTS